METRALHVVAHKHIPSCCKMQKAYVLHYIYLPENYTCVFMILTHFHRSTGFILEGFPHHPDEVQYMLQQQLFPDIFVVLAVDVADVQKRLLPTHLGKWRERRNHRESQLNLLRNLQRKNRVGKLVIKNNLASSIIRN